MLAAKIGIAVLPFTGLAMNCKLSNASWKFKIQYREYCTKTVKEMRAHMAKFKLQRDMKLKIYNTTYKTTAVQP